MFLLFIDMSSTPTNITHAMRSRSRFRGNRNLVLVEMGVIGALESLYSSIDTSEYQFLSCKTTCISADPTYPSHGCFTCMPFDIR